MDSVINEQSMAGVEVPEGGRLSPQQPVADAVATLMTNWHVAAPLQTYVEVTTAAVERIVTLASADLGKMMRCLHKIDPWATILLGHAAGRDPRTIYVQKRRRTDEYLVAFFDDPTSTKSSDAYTTTNVNYARLVMMYATYTSLKQRFCEDMNGLAAIPNPVNRERERRKQCKLYYLIANEGLRYVQ